jgi:hypothetical protein
MEDSWIRLDDEGGQYRPGQKIGGRAGWRLEKAPKKADVRLFWYTAGIGTRDVEVVGTVPMESPRAEDEQAFSFVLPTSPYSFSGQLVTLTWAVELVIEPGEQTQRVEFVLTPTGEAIVLPKVEDPTRRKGRIRVGT